MKRFCLYLVLTIVVSAMAGWGAAFYQHKRLVAFSDAEEIRAKAVRSHESEAAYLRLASKKYAEVYSIRFCSKSGDLLALGTINLKTPLTAVGVARGDYFLQMAEARSKDSDVFWFYQLFHEKEIGVVDWGVFQEQAGDRVHSINFMPGTYDANVRVHFNPLNNGFSTGVWFYELLSGGYQAGTFEIEKR